MTDFHVKILGFPRVCLEMKNLGHSEKKIFNLTLPGHKFRNSLYIFQGKHPEFRRMAEFRRNLLNATAQAFSSSNMCGFLWFPTPSMCLTFQEKG